MAPLARPGEDAWRLFELKQCEGGTTQDWLAAVPKLVIEEATSSPEPVVHSRTSPLSRRWRMRDDRSERGRMLS